MSSLLSRASKAVVPAFMVGVLVGAATVGTATAVINFPDVRTGDYFYGAVSRLSEAGIIKGMPDGTFRPGDLVTRADVAVMIDRAINGTDAGTGSDGGGSVTSRGRRSSSSKAASSEISASSEKGAFRFAVGSFNVSEGAGKASFSVIRSGGSEGTVTIRYELNDGTAIAGTDYNDASGVLTFSEGETTKILNLSLKNNSSADPNRTFIIELSEPTGGSVLGDPSKTTVTILDDDGGGGNATRASSSAASVAAAGSTSSTAGGAISLNAGSFAVSESAGTATITVKRTGTTSAAVNVNYTVTNGSATSGTHYNQTNGTLNFAAGESSKTFTIAVINNSDIGGNKTVNIALSSPTGGAVLESPATALLTIWDDEANTPTSSGSIQFSSENYLVTESVGTATVTVSRTLNYNGTVTVAFATSNGLAIAPSDYASVSTTLTFLPGEMSKVIGIPVVKDTNSEPEEGINLNLSSVTGNATLGSPSLSLLKIASH